MESGQLKMAKESGKGSNSYKIGEAAKAVKVVKAKVAKASALYLFSCGSILFMVRSL